MDTSEYPSRINNIFYGLQKQEPSYRTEFPQDLPYDPGATSSLFELNYLPTKTTPLILGILAIFLLYVFLRKNFRLSILLPALLSLALLLTVLGPIRLPSILRFNTILGFVKFLGLVLAGFSIVQILQKRSIEFFKTSSILPIGLYVISLLLSVFVMTNVTFFWNDFSIVVTGLLFYYLSFSFFSWTETKKILIGFSWLVAAASGIVILVFVSRSFGSNLVSFLYPKYEVFVFMHDLIRGRIFSIIDFEYFTPCLVFAYIVYAKRKQFINKYLLLMIIGLSLGAIVLVNYRYRFLTFGLGFALMWLFLSEERKKFVKPLLTVMGLLFGVYIAVSLIYSRSTIIDRFLLRNYHEDKLSVDRRLVMYGQALELFTQAPVLGVGLGNYKDNVQIVYSRFGGRVYEPYYKILQNVYAYPHNWYLTVLAENGIVGFVVLLWMLMRFFEIDFRLSKTLRLEQLWTFAALSSISWLYLFANLFTMMHVSLPMVIIFWACRGMIERIHSEHARQRLA